MNTLQPPRRETAQEFYTQIVELGEFTLTNYLAEVRAGTRLCDFAEVRELQENIKVCKAELEKYK